MKKQSSFASWALLLVALGANAGTASANSIFTVTLNTNPLVGSLSGPFAVAFQLTDGSGLSDNNNIATLTSFTFGGGSAGGCPLNCTTTGGATGDMTSTITLRDNSFFNSSAERFTVGTSLSFQVNLTTNVDAGGTPDTFAFGLLDKNGNPITTLDPLGSNTFLSIDIDSANPTILTYATPPGGTITLNAPTIGAPPPPPPPPPPNGQTPEPRSLLLLGAGLLGLAAVKRLRPKK